MNWYKQSALGNIGPYLDFIARIAKGPWGEPGSYPKDEEYVNLDITEEQLQTVINFVLQRINTLDEASIKYLNALLIFAFRLEIDKGFKMSGFKPHGRIGQKIANLLKKDLQGTTYEERCAEYVQKVDEISTKIDSLLSNYLKVHDLDVRPGGEQISYQQCKWRMEDKAKAEQTNELV